MTKSTEASNFYKALLQAFFIFPIDIPGVESSLTSACDEVSWNVYEIHVGMFRTISELVSCFRFKNDSLELF